MALVDNAWYVNFGDGATTGYYGVTKWANKTAVAGEIIRQFTAPAVGSERCFVCIVAGATGSTEPTWVNTRGAKNTSSVAVYQECTGIAALNGDLTHTPNWTTIKNTAVTLGQVIQRNSGASYQICTTAGTAGNGSEPAFSNTAGTTTADNTVTWTSLGAVGNFTGWQAPHARVANALAANWGQAGNDFYVGDNHAETQASGVTWTSVGTAALPIRILCVDHLGSKPPVSADLKTTATVTASGAASITLNGVLSFTDIDGIIFTAGSGGNVSNAVGFTGNGMSLRAKNCAFRIAATGGGGRINIGGAGLAGSRIEWENTTVQFGNTTDRILVTSALAWRNTASAITGATLPTSLFINAAAGGGLLNCSGVDFSAITGNIFLAVGNAVAVDVNLSDCKINAAATIANMGAATPGSLLVDYARCASDATNYRHGRIWYEGTESEETTIVRTGGASDGTTSVAEKIVTTANSSRNFPFESLPLTFWNDTIGSAITVTLYGIWGGGAVPNIDDIFMEAEYLGSTLTPQASFANSGPVDVLAASAANTSDVSSWGGSTTAFKMAVTFTPQLKGPVTLRVKAAKASSTFYIDPRPVISGVTFSKSEILAPGLYANDLQSGAAGMLFIPDMTGT